MKKPHFITNNIYHIYNRGVEKRDIFQDDKDRLRFIHCLFEFNDKAPAKNIFHYITRQSSEVQPHYLRMERKPRKLLVDILAFCLMPNHYHLMVRQRKDGGIVRFMQKLGTGYTMYFNKKHGRVGPLFQGRFKAASIIEEQHFVYLPYYIHLNPLDMLDEGWRTRNIRNHKEAEQFLKSYRWSSHLDYCEKKNFPSVTQREFLSTFWNDPQRYQNNIKKWLRDVDIKPLQKIILE